MPWQTRLSASCGEQQRSLQVRSAKALLATGSFVITNMHLVSLRRARSRFPVSGNWQAAFAFIYYVYFMCYFTALTPRHEQEAPSQTEHSIRFHGACALSGGMCFGPRGKPLHHRQSHQKAGSRGSYSHCQAWKKDRRGTGAHAEGEAGILEGQSEQKHWKGKANRNTGRAKPAGTLEGQSLAVSLTAQSRAPPGHQEQRRYPKYPQTQRMGRKTGREATREVAAAPANLPSEEQGQNHRGNHGGRGA